MTPAMIKKSNNYNNNISSINMSPSIYTIFLKGRNCNTVNDIGGWKIPDIIELHWASFWFRLTKMILLIILKLFRLLNLFHEATPK